MGAVMNARYKKSQFNTGYLVTDGDARWFRTDNEEEAQLITAYLKLGVPFNVEAYTDGLTRYHRLVRRDDE